MIPSVVIVGGVIGVFSLGAVVGSIHTTHEVDYGGETKEVTHIDIGWVLMCVLGIFVSAFGVML